MQLVNYSEIALRHGRKSAMEILRTIERLAAVDDKVVPIDIEMRFENALKALSECRTGT